MTGPRCCHNRLMKSLNILLGCDNLKSTGVGTTTRELNNELLIFFS